MHVSAPKKTLWLLQNRYANALMTTTKQGVKGLGESFGGRRRGPTGKLATEEERHCKGEHMIMVWGEVVHENEGH